MGSDSVGWAGGTFTIIRKTTNQGITWGSQNTNVTNTALSAADIIHAWTGGFGMAHTTDGGGPVLSIQQISTEIPDGFVLYQNYPNPFNGSTKISFAIPERTEIKLILYDIKGSLVKELVSGNYSAGDYEFTFETSDLSSGVYY